MWCDMVRCVMATWFECPRLVGLGSKKVLMDCRVRPLRRRLEWSCVHGVLEMGHLSKGVNDEWNQCPVFPLDVRSSQAVSQAEADDGSKLED